MGTESGAVCTTSAFLSDRVFEYTDEAVKRQFTGIDGTDFDALMKFPMVSSPTKGRGRYGFPSAGSVKLGRAAGDSKIIYTLPNIYPKNRDERSKGFFETLGNGEQTGLPSGAETHWGGQGTLTCFEVTTRLLYEADNSSVVLSVEDMNRVWGEGYKRGRLVFSEPPLGSQGAMSPAVSRTIGESGNCDVFLAHEDVTPHHDMAERKSSLH